MTKIRETETTPETGSHSARQWWRVTGNVPIAELKSTNCRLSRKKAGRYIALIAIAKTIPERIFAGN